MTQPIGIFASLVGIITGGIGIYNSTKSYKFDALGTLIWSIVLVLSIIFLFVSLYSLHSYNQSKRRNELLEENNDMLEQILLSLNPDNDYHKAKEQEEIKSTKPQEMPIQPKDGVQTYQTFLMKRKDSSLKDDDK